MLFLILAAGCRQQPSLVAREPVAEPEPIPADLSYWWKEQRDAANALANRVRTPDGFQRVAVEPGSFAAWLRWLPLKPGTPRVRLHTGALKWNQRAHAAVVDLDVGTKNLQQCADSVIRLRAEYLFAREQYDDIHFRFTNGTPAVYTAWAEGQRPVVNGNRVRWTASARPDRSYENFRRYLDSVFTYAGSLSLSREMRRVCISEMQIGDVFIVGGTPGHAAMVLDMAENPRTGERLFLLAQGYMPAQDFHLLKNPRDPGRSPWYSTQIGEALETPEFTFTAGDLMRFK